MSIPGLSPILCKLKSRCKNQSGSRRRAEFPVRRLDCHEPEILQAVKGSGATAVHSPLTAWIFLIPYLGESLHAGIASLSIQHMIDRFQVVCDRLFPYLRRTSACSGRHEQCTTGVPFQDTLPIWVPWYHSIRPHKAQRCPGHHDFSTHSAQKARFRALILTDRNLLVSFLSG